MQEEMEPSEGPEEKLYLCRLCLTKSQFFYSLVDEGVVEIIENFTSVKIDEDDELPTNCCSKCLEEVYLVCKIRNRIIESDRALRERLKNDEDIKCGPFEVPMPLTVEIVDETGSAIKSEVEIIEPEIEVESHDIKFDFTINPEINEVFRRKIEMKRRAVARGESADVSSSSTQMYSCGECPQSFRSNKLYAQHLKKHQVVSVCNICGIQVLSCNLRRHLDVHESSPKVCELCGKVAKNAESLRGHMFYQHKSTADKYKCAQCGRCFRYKYKYLLHLRKHGDERTHICEVCGKAFFTSRDVNRHIKMTHMKLRPFICQYCNKGFSSAYARRTHVRQHTNEKPFKCDVCAEGFRQRVSLKTHLKSKHGIIAPPTQTEYTNKPDPETVSIIQH